MSTDDSEKRDYVLLKDHRHNGLWRLRGETLQLPKKLGDWLVAQHIAQPAGLVIPASFAAPKAALLRQAPGRTVKRRCCGW